MASLLPALGGAFCGLDAIWTIRKLLSPKIPAGLTVNGYHEFLKTHTSLDDLRTLAVDGDIAVAALSHIVFLLSLYLMFSGIFYAILVGCEILGNRRSNEEN